MATSEFQLFPIFLFSFMTADKYKKCTIKDHKLNHYYYKYKYIWNVYIKRWESLSHSGNKNTISDLDSITDIFYYCTILIVLSPLLAH